MRCRAPAMMRSRRRCAAEAESEVEALLRSVDEGHGLDIEGLSCRDAWKALQPANRANVMLRMVTDLSRERLADHKSVAKYTNKARTVMQQLFSDSEARGLVTEAFKVLCTLKTGVDGEHLHCEEGDHGWLLQHASIGKRCRSIGQALGATETDQEAVGLLCAREQVRQRQLL